jgi:protein-S-isoprenylcysteine O-methyltransferase Ste14/membrane protease YdiL (CAAX protease family)
MNVALETIEKWTGWLGGAAVVVTLGIIFYGIAQGMRRPLGGSPGQSARMVRSPIFLILVSLGYFGLCWLLWHPIPLPLSTSTRIAALILGVPLFFSGLALILWARLTLGKWYNVSTSQEAPLYAGHRLITSGPFAFIRHPMYLGILLVGLGGILLYQTWTMVFFALNFPGLVLRARREELALTVEFGDAWRAYCRQTPRWLPHVDRKRMPPGVSALLELVVMFLPSIPAYLWLWPTVGSDAANKVMSLVYVYTLVGALWIGLRRWNLSQLGINLSGLWLSLVCGLILLAGRLAVILSVTWRIQPPELTPLRLAGQVLFYFALVGLGEELLFRGLIFRALEEWLGVRWAIWGSSFGFVLWHIFGQGPVVGAAMLFYGLIFALMRWRAGGIVGLIVVHGLMDLQAALLVSDSNVEIISQGRPEIPYPALLVLGLVLLVLLPIYLWKLHPVLLSRLRFQKK